MGALACTNNNMFNALGLVDSHLTVAELLPEFNGKSMVISGTLIRGTYYVYPYIISYNHI
jgi:hypothetical protein